MYYCMSWSITDMPRISRIAVMTIATRKYSPVTLRKRIILSMLFPCYFQRRLPLIQNSLLPCGRYTAGPSSRCRLLFSYQTSVPLA